MAKADDRKLEELFAEKGWSIDLLDDLRFLHSLDRENYPLYLQDPYTMFPMDPEEWFGMLVKYGYLAFGNCPNGDFIALDCSKDVGSVVYISHEEFHYDPSSTEDIGDITRCISSSIRELIEGLEKESVPLDYYEE